MKNTQGGFIGIVVIVLVALAVIGGGAYIYTQKDSSKLPGSKKGDFSYDYSTFNPNDESFYYSFDRDDYNFDGHNDRAVFLGQKNLNNVAGILIYNPQTKSSPNINPEDFQKLYPELVIVAPQIINKEDKLVCSIEYLSEKERAVKAYEYKNDKFITYKSEKVILNDDEADVSYSYFCFR